MTLELTTLSPSYILSRKLHCRARAHLVHWWAATPLISLRAVQTQNPKTHHLVLDQRMFYHIYGRTTERMFIF
jgi:hypothetical protein